VTARFEPHQQAVPPRGVVPAGDRPHGELPPGGAPLEGAVPLRRIGSLRFRYAGQELCLGAYWVEGYAGGLFVPFRDETSGRDSYGGGRYLLDTIKSADLGSDADSGEVTLDFNYAYHPSCAYDPRWVCPLAPPENRLPLAIRAGERLGPSAAGDHPAPGESARLRPASARASQGEVSA
jgi:hypothetical protein